MRLFGKEWFTKHQRVLRWVADTHIGRRFFCIDGDRSGLGKYRLESIMPNYITWKNGTGLVYEFRTHNRFSRRLWYWLNPLWRIFHIWDTVFYPNLNLGFDSYGPYYPDPDPESTTVDGYIYHQEATGAAFTTIRAASGNHSNSGPSGGEGEAVSIRCYSYPYFSWIFRSLFLFNTAALPDAAVISTATFSVCTTTDTSNGFSYSDFSICTVSSNPASNTALTPTDYTTLGTTEFSNKIGYSSCDTTAYQPFSLNTAGIAAISKTGITKFGLREATYDITGTAPSWEEYKNMKIYCRYADYSGTASDPKLVVETATAPVLDTASATSVSYTTATGNGEITNYGGAVVTTRGVCWSTGANPTTANSHTTESGSFYNGVFTGAITSLINNTLYHYRAYGTNSVGTGYGDDVQFTTLDYTVPVLDTKSATSILTTTATGNGEVTDDGGDTITARGFCWSTSANPTTSDGHTTDSGSYHEGEFSGSMTSLSASTLYHYRAYGTNSKGTSYGDDVTFTTATPGSPEVTTIQPVIIRRTKAELCGNITVGDSVTTIGIAYSITANPTIADSTVSGTGTFGKGRFRLWVTGLTPDTVYHFRPYVTNVTGTGYGLDTQFRTQSSRILIEDGS
jgi:hypothetical protein